MEIQWLKIDETIANNKSKQHFFYYDQHLQSNIPFLGVGIWKGEKRYVYIPYQSEYYINAVKEK